MPNRFEVNHLKYFYFTVLEGGVGQAAQRLHVQQPVVSKMLTTLAEGFGQPLFRKSGRRKVLTDFGQLVYRHCRTIFHEIEKLDSLNQSDQALTGPLSFGCSEAIAHHSLVAVLQELAHSHPRLNPNIYVSTARHLVELVAQRKLEFTVLFHLPELPTSLEIYRKIPLRFRLVISHRQKSNSQVIERFIGSREIDDTLTHRFPTLERLRRDHKQAHIGLSSNHLGLHRLLVLQGYGTSILPDYLIQSDLRQRKLYDLYPQEKFVFDLKIVTAKSEVLSKAADQLIQRLTSQMTQRGRGL